VTIVKIGDDIFEVKLTFHKMKKEKDNNRSSLYEAKVIFKSRVLSPLHSIDRKKGDKESISFVVVFVFVVGVSYLFQRSFYFLA
jgi:hypothetical protein